MIENRRYELDRNAKEKKWAMEFGEQAGYDRLELMKIDGILAREKAKASQKVAIWGMEFDEEQRQKTQDGMSASMKPSILPDDNQEM